MEKNHEVEFLVFEKFIEAIAAKYDERTATEPIKKTGKKKVSKSRTHLEFRNGDFIKIHDQLSSDYIDNVPSSNTIKGYFYIVREGYANYRIVTFKEDYVDTLSDYIGYSSYQAFYIKTAAELGFPDTSETRQTGSSPKKKVEEASSTSQSPPFKSEQDVALDKQAILLGQLKEKSKSYRNSLYRGRFQNVKIEQVLLADASLASTLPTEVKNRDKQLDLLTAIKSLGAKDIPHAIILGSGGMGKTTSLLHIWERLLEEKDQPTPLFIALNEYNNASKNERKKFILRYIIHHYLGESSPTEATENLIWPLLKKNPEKEQPGIVLLLDGFNEVTSNLDDLIGELSKLSTEALNVQLIITSRYVEIQNYTWAQNSEVLELVDLEKSTIKDYLSKSNVPVPSEDGKLFKLFGNPMMLTLYVGTEQISEEYSDHRLFSFFKVQTEAELLWNFNEALLAKSFKEFESKRNEYFFAAFLIRYVVPYIAWKMEKEGLFFISQNSAKNFNFNTVIGEACEKLKQRSILEEFSDVPKVVNLISGELKDELGDFQRSKEIKDYLTRHLNLLVQEGSDLRFLHQNFRDFYAALHLRNCITFSLSREKRPNEWKERTFPTYLRKMIGELEGEYLFDAQELLQGKEIPTRIKNNLITRLIDSCRDQDMTNEYTIWNLVTILHEARSTLAGSDLSSLDLRGLILNNIPISAYNGKKYLEAKLRKAIVNGKDFIFQGHKDLVNSAVYSPDGQNVLTASIDGTVKEWSMLTGECKLTLPHTSPSFEILEPVIFAEYSNDGKKVLSTNATGQIKEWILSEKKLAMNQFSPIGEPFGAQYNEDGNILIYFCKYFSLFILVRIKISFYNNQIINNLLRTLSMGLLRIVMKLFTYYFKQTLRFKLYSRDHRFRKSKIIKYIYFIENILFYHYPSDIIKKFPKTILADFVVFNEHFISLSSYFTYSKKHKKSLVISYKKTSEFSTVNGEKIRDIDINLDKATSISYSHDGQNLIAGFEDGWIKEWSLDTGICLKNLSCHKQSITSVMYNPKYLDRFISASDDGTVKEWSLGSGKCLKTITVHSNKINPIAFNDENKKNKTFIPRKLKSKFNVKEDDNQIGSVAYSPNGQRILVASFDGKVKEFEVSYGVCIRTFLAHEQAVNMAIYSQYGSRFFTGSNDCTIKELDISTGKEIKKFTGHDQPVYLLALEKYEKKILSVSIDKTIKEWDILTGICVNNFKGHNTKVKLIVYNELGDKVFSVSIDGTIKEWSVESGNCTKTTKPFPMKADPIAFSKDRDRIIFNKPDGSIYEYIISTEDIIKIKSEYNHKSIYYSDSQKILLIKKRTQLEEWSIINSQVLRTITIEDYDGLRWIILSPCEKKICMVFYGGIIREIAIQNGKLIRQYLTRDPGLLVQSLDLRDLHPDSTFTEDEKARLRRYGAIFDDQDELEWNKAVEDAYGDMEEA